MTNLFSWLRSKVRDAILDGANDALGVLGAEEPCDSAATVRLSVSLKLPDDGPVKNGHGRKNGQRLPVPAGE